SIVNFSEPLSESRQDQKALQVVALEARRQKIRDVVCAACVFRELVIYRHLFERQMLPAVCASLVALEPDRMPEMRDRLSSIRGLVTPVSRSRAFEYSDSYAIEFHLT